MTELTVTNIITINSVTGSVSEFSKELDCWRDSAGTGKERKIMKHTDALIIGFGKGGKTLAAIMAGAGKSVTLVEKSAQMYGGTCINVACIPTKSLVNSAALSAAQGGGFAEKQARYESAVRQKDELTNMLRAKNYQKLQGLSNVTVVTGTAAFMGPRRVSVALAQGGREEWEAEQVFINTGARPFIPPVKGLKESRYAFVSEEMLELKRLPRRLAIIGGGYIGIEFASMYANFGSSVTVIQDGEAFLPREDGEIAGAVLESMSKRGIRVIRSARVLSVKDEDGFAVVEASCVEGEIRLEADAILVATGRRPNVEGMNLEACGVQLTARGGVKTDEHLRTTAPGVWAMGDVTGGLQFTYISLDDSRIVSSDILGSGGRTTENRGAVPYSVFLDPPFSRVGLTEKEALDQGLAVKVFRLAAGAIPKARVLQKPEGLLKAVVDAKTGLILGAHLFCEESHEMINLVKLAMDAGLSYTVLRDAVYTHPTMTESLNDLFHEA